MSEPDRTAVALEELLAHQGWVRRLAANLVRDPAHADDVVQETWLTALESPPPRRTALAAWLARVVRSRTFDLFRSEARRAERERRAACGEAVLPAPDAAAEAETCRRLAEAVCALPPAGREVVVLHYYRGLTRREVADRLGVPLETVRTRLRRALERLRAELGGEAARERWEAALLPLALAPGRRLPIAGLLGGGLVMATKLKVAGAVVLLALLAAGAWKLATPVTTPDEDGPAPEGRVARAPAIAPSSPVAPEAPAPSVPEPGPAVAPSAPPPVSPGTPEPTTVPPGTILGRVRLADGGSPVGTAVALTWVSPPQPGGDNEQRHGRVEADGDGSFRLDGIAPGTCHLRVMRPGYGTEEVSLTMNDAAGPDPVEVVLRTAGALVVRVRSRMGEPAARIFLWIRGPRPGLGTAASTDADGLARLDDLAPGRWTVSVRGKAGGVMAAGGPPRPGDRPVEVASGETAELTIDLGLAVVAGSVRLPDGRPVEKGFVYLRRMRPEFQNLSAPVGADGRFRLDAPVEGELEVSVNVFAPGRFLCSAGKTTLALGETTELEIRIADTAIAGRLRRADGGEPVAKASVIARAVAAPEDGQPARPADGAAGGSAWPDEDGVFALVGLPPSTYELRAFPHDRRLAQQTRVVVLPATGRLEGVDFAFEVKPVGTLRLRVLDENGAGCEQVQISVNTGSTRSTFPGTHLGGGVHEIVLDPGKHAVEVQVPGYHVESIAVEIAEAETLEREVRLTPFRR